MQHGEAARSGIWQGRRLTCDGRARDRRPALRAAIGARAQVVAALLAIGRAGTAPPRSPVEQDRERDRHAENEPVLDDVPIESALICTEEVVRTIEPR